MQAALRQGNKAAPAGLAAMAQKKDDDDEGSGGAADFDDEIPF